MQAEDFDIDDPLPEQDLSSNYIYSRPLTETKRIESVWEQKKRKLRPAVKKRFRPEEVLEVIEKTHGMSTAICTALDCTYTQWNGYLKEFPEAREAVECARSWMIDLAEKKLIENLNSTDRNLSQKAAEFILRRLGAKRGWSDNPALIQQIQVTTTDKEKEIQIKQIFGIENDNQTSGMINNDEYT